MAAAIFGPLAEANINVDMIVQNVSADGKTTDLTFTVPAADYQRSLDVIVKAKPAIGYARLDGATDVAKISVIGIGMRSHAGVAAQAFRALADRAINIRAITTSEIKFSLLDRRGVYRACGAHAALALRSRQGAGRDGLGRSRPRPRQRRITRDFVIGVRKRPNTSSRCGAQYSAPSYPCLWLAVCMPHSI